MVAQTKAIRHGNVDPAGWFKDSSDLFESTIQLGEVLQGMVANNEIDARRGQRQVLAASDNPPRHTPRIGRCMLESRSIFIHSDDRAVQIIRREASACRCYIQNATAL